MHELRPIDKNSTTVGRSLSMASNFLLVAKLSRDRYMSRFKINPQSQSFQTTALKQPPGNNNIAHSKAQRTRHKEDWAKARLPNLKTSKQISSNNIRRAEITTNIIRMIYTLMNNFYLLILSTTYQP